MIKVGISENKWNNVWVYGSVEGHGLNGYIEKVDYNRPFPYYIITEDSSVGLWYPREAFKYIEPQLSIQAAFTAIENAVNNPDAIGEIKAILEQYHNTKNRV